MDWYVYMVRCSDNSLYSGITTDTERRVREHNGEVPGVKKGAKYTAARQPVELVYFERAADRAKAASKEAALKSLTKTQKEALVAGEARHP